MSGRNTSLRYEEHNNCDRHSSAIVNSILFKAILTYSEDNGTQIRSGLGGFLTIRKKHNHERERDGHDQSLKSYSVPYCDVPKNPQPVANQCQEERDTI